MLAVTGVSTVTLLLFAGALLYRVHTQAHRRTDAMLLQMARTEADGVIKEIEAHGIHVHDTTVTLPTVEGLAAEKHAFVYGPDCRLQASTSNIDVVDVPEAWCERDLELGRHRVFETDAVADASLRVASFVARKPDGEPVVFAAGVESGLVDRAFRRTVLLTGLLVLVVVVAVGGVSAYVSRRLTADMASLSEACREVPDDVSQMDQTAIEQKFAVADDAPRELAILGETIRSLIGKVKRMVGIQNQFIAEAAHELRTPLTALQGDLELALRRERSAEEYREALERAESDAGRLSELTEQLLEVARSQSDAVVEERVFLPEVLDESLRRFEGELDDAEIEVDVEYEQEHRLEVAADETSVRRIFSNLIDNVVQHSGADRLAIAIRPGEPIDGDETLALHFRDDGVGIPDDEVESLFTPFHGRRDDEGHGLGLYLARRLARSHGGDLRLVEPGTDDGGAHWVVVFRRWKR